MSNELVYALKLAEYKWYVGTCSEPNLPRRLTEHFRSQGATWTRLFKPVSVDAVYRSPATEDQVLKAYARMVGWMNVRGQHVWSDWRISYKPKDFRPKLMTYLDPEHLKLSDDAVSEALAAMKKVPPSPPLGAQPGKLRPQYDAWFATLRPSVRQAMHPTASITRR
jgi:predicted GIY-YIG superfamily endonuclease